MNRFAFVFVLGLPTTAFGQVMGVVDWGGSLGRVVLLDAVVELAALDPPASRGSVRCRPRPRLLTPMLVAHTGFQLSDAHSTLRGLAAGAVEANPSPIAQWAVSVSGAGLRGFSRHGRADVVGAGVIACHYPRPALWTVVALNGLYAVVVTHNYRLGSRLLAR